MATLATVNELKTYMGLEGAAEDPILNEILDDAQAILEADVDELFLDTGSVTDEAHDGTGLQILYLNRPASAVAEAKIGQDAAAPDETLTTTDLIVDGRKLIRRDMRKFPDGRQNVFVTYTAAKFLPPIARMALLEGATFLFRRRGREHVTAETVGEFGSISLAAQLRRQPAWAAALRTLRRPVMV